VPLLSIPAARGRDNVTRLGVEDADGTPFNLDTAGATRATVSVCTPLQSATVEATWAGAIVEVVLGGLDLPPGTYPAKLVYYSATRPDGEVLAGPGFVTMINIGMVC